MTKASVWDKVWQAVRPESIDVRSALGEELARLMEALLPQSGSLLEAGSGSGELSARLRADGFRCTLLDESSVALALARQVFDLHQLGGDFAQGDIFTLPFPDNHFDCVWNSGVLEHYSDEDMVFALREMARVSKRYVVTLVPNSHNLAYQLSMRIQQANGKWKYGLERPQHSMAKLFAQADLKMVGETHLGHQLTAHWLLELGIDDPMRLDEVRGELEGLAAVNPQITGYLLASVGVKTPKAEDQYLAQEHRQEHEEMVISGWNESPIREADIKSFLEETQTAWFNNVRLTGDLRLAKAQVKLVEDQNHELNGALSSVETRLYTAENTLREVYGSRSWKIANRIKLLVRPARSLRRWLLGKLSRLGTRTVAYKVPSQSIPTKYDVIIWSIINWDFRHQRPQQIAKRFALNGHRVFYINVSFSQEGVPNYYTASDGITVLELPLAQAVSVYTNIATEETAQQLVEAIDSVRLDYMLMYAIQMVELPFWGKAAELLRRKFDWPIIYDCMDEHSGFSTSSPSVADAERELDSLSDAIIVSSDYLYQKKVPLGKQLALVRNGCEYDHFSMAAHRVVNTESMAKRRPIIGYFGAIAEWFDMDLLYFLASRNVEWDFQLIGSTAGADISSVGTLKNVEFLGEQPYDSLPGFLANFDVCIIPFKINELTRATNPVKVYEYLSSGKPVVATAMPEVVKIGRLVAIGDTYAEFEEAIRLALGTYDPELVQERMAFAKANDWNARYQMVDNAVRRSFPLISVVVVTYNNLHYTKKCMETLRTKSVYPNIEVVVVDNGSSDRTRDYLEKEREDGSWTSLKIVLNEANEGFARANNMGIAQATGEFIVLLNNDTAVTPGWMWGLKRVLDNNPSLGMIGPVTDHIGNEAQINVTVTSDEGLDFAAAKLLAENFGQVRKMRMLALFCVAMRRQVFEEIGPLDERFGIGMFEDDDWSMRVRLADYELGCAEDIFIHHEGSASFSIIEDGDYRQLFERNRKLYEDKWKVTWQPHRGR